MNNISKLLLGLAVVGLASCSNDEPAPAPDNGGISGDVAYLNVNITADGSRADGSITEGEGDAATDKYYEFGTDGENEVTDAYFYFYDDKGNYMYESHKWLKDDQTPTENVNVFGKNTIILEGLTSKGLPRYVVTVLNQAEGFTPAATLDLMKTQLVTALRDGDIVDGKQTGNFTMTTSSFVNTAEDKSNVRDGLSPYYFATVLEASDFYEKQPNHEEATAVEIYVERLAARVQVFANLSNPSTTYTKDGKTGTIYELDATVGGSDNGGEGGGNVADTKLYVELLGWELSATAKQSLLVKNIESLDITDDFGGNWDIRKDWNEWNDSEYHRSYWGKAWTYGKSGDELKSMLDIKHTYGTLDEIIGVGATNSSIVYCAENTNNVGNISTEGVPSPQHATTVILKARVCDKDGNGVYMVNYLGSNYFKDAFIQYVLRRLNLKYYSRTPKLGEDGQQIVGKDKDGNNVPLFNYTQLTYSQDEEGNWTKDVDLVSAGDGLGTVDVQLATDKTFYTLGEPVEVTYKYTDKEGTEHTVTTTTYPATEVAGSTINAALLAATTDDNGNFKAIAYNDGAMVYPIPLEHLNNPKGEDAVEGQWGVVRNHSYRVNVTKLVTLGNGVFRPEQVGDDEAEIIDPNKPKTPTYYVESKINILSWKIVSQDVEI